MNSGANVGEKTPKGGHHPLLGLSQTRTCPSSGTVEVRPWWRPTSTTAANFIDLLRTKYVIGQAGVTFMPGVGRQLVDPEDERTGATAYHVAEGLDVTESAPTLANVTGHAAHHRRRWST
jgi:hypothetical protein